jgi:hypothetical protein
VKLVTWRPDPRLVAGLLAGGLGYWLYVQSPGRSLVSALQEVQRLFGSITLSPAQEQMVGIITSEAVAAGFHWLAIPAVVNAYAESRLNPLASGDGGHSIGLFQLHDAGAGAGMSLAARLDPAQNAARIFIEVAGGHGVPLRAMRGQTNAVLTRAFAEHIERCFACNHGGGSGELDVRELLLSSLYGTAVAAQRP